MRVRVASRSRVIEPVGEHGSELPPAFRLPQFLMNHGSDLYVEKVEGGPMSPKPQAAVAASSPITGTQ